MTSKRTFAAALLVLGSLAACTAGKEKEKDPRTAAEGGKTEEEKQKAAQQRAALREGIREKLEETTATMILTNANVITLDPKAPKAEAVAIHGEKIVFVGSAADALKMQARGTEIVDLGGATVIPGLVDGHAHLASLRESLETVRLVDTTSWKQVVDLTAERAKKTPKGEWIVGDGWDQNDWDGAKEFPAHGALSSAVPDHPVILYRIDGHAAIVNAKAMEIAKLDKSAKAPVGGKIILGRDGDLTGVLVDDAMDLVTKHVPAATVTQTKERIVAAQAECLKHGLTGMHDAGVTATGLQAYEELVKENRLVLRVYAMLAGDPKLIDEWFAKKPLIGDRFTVRSVKLYADGALGSRGAALLAPYADEPANSGLLRMDASEIEAITVRALQAGYQVNVHAIGDRANRAALNGFERARASVPAATDPRLRIEHAQVIAPEDIPRFAKLGVIASMQPTHATSDMPWAEARVGKERAKGAYAWRSLLKTGAKLNLGSDFPVEGVDPLWGLHAAVTRTDRKGSPKGGWRAEEKLTAQEALAGFTIGPAYAAFEEATHGTIEKGKLADLVVLSGDPIAAPEKILSLEVKKTIVGGKVAYSE